jgi:hypothetical protein
MKTKPPLQAIEHNIQNIKAQLGALGPLRPGSLSRQYHVCCKPVCHCQNPQKTRRHGPYYHLDYVHHGKKTTRFIRAKQVPELRRQLANFKKLRRLVDQWITLSLHRAEVQCQRSAKSGLWARKPHSWQDPPKKLNGGLLLANGHFQSWFSLFWAVCSSVFKPRAVAVVPSEFAYFFRRKAPSCSATVGFSFSTSDILLQVTWKTLMWHIMMHLAAGWNGSEIYTISKTMFQSNS